MACVSFSAMCQFSLSRMLGYLWFSSLWSFFRPGSFEFPKNLGTISRGRLAKPTLLFFFTWAWVTNDFDEGAVHSLCELAGQDNQCRANPAFWVAFLIGRIRFLPSNSQGRSVSVPHGNVQVKVTLPASRDVGEVLSSQHAWPSGREKFKLSLELDMRVEV